MLTGCEELSLDKSEAQSMNSALKEVARHYPTQIDPKKLAIANLVVVLGGIYGTRAVAIRTRLKNEAKNRPQNVRPMVVQQRPQAATGTESRGQAKQPEPEQLLPSQIWNEPAAEFTNA